MGFWPGLTVTLISGPLGDHGRAPDQEKVRDGADSQEVGQGLGGAGPVAHDPAPSMRRAFEELRAQHQAWEHEYNDLRPHLARKGETSAARLCELRISFPPPVRRAT